MIKERAREIVENVAADIKIKTEISILDLVEHTASLRWLGGKSLYQSNCPRRWIEAEQITGRAVDSVNCMVIRIPNGGAPVISHAVI